ncbi:MAG: bifunctional serine/threonine-protein kinase/formylglycine-generating enzyme family protein [Polyangiaceae bacterium]
MDRDHHLRIALSAYRAGLLTTEGYTKAVIDIARLDREIDPNIFWIQQGRLGFNELQRALIEVAPISMSSKITAVTAALSGGKKASSRPDPVPPSQVSTRPGDESRTEVTSSDLERSKASEVADASTPPNAVALLPRMHPSSMVTRIVDPSERTPLIESPKIGVLAIDPTALSRSGNTGIPPTAYAPPVGEHTNGLGLPGPPPRGHEMAIERYVTLGVLGAGGMGEVYECVDRALNRKIAIKLARAGAGIDDLSVSMLEREARVIGSLEHPNIIPVYDAGRSTTQQPFYTMRLLRHPTLDGVIRELAKGEPAAVANFSLGRLLRDFIQVCHAIDYAHSRGVIHCDIKPSNIMVGEYGEVMVVDWGLAYRVGERPAYRGGTPSYMAPEQFANSDSFDARTDVFALGAVLYEILCLVPAFEGIESITVRGNTDEVPARNLIAPRERAPFRGIPEELEEACLTALRVNPDERFASARALAEAVENFLEGTKERERRAARAADLTSQGEALAESYFELIESRPERLEEISTLRAEIAPWEPPARKQALWDAEERVGVLDALCIRTLQAAITAYEAALDEVPHHVGARAGLARLYRYETRRAISRRDETDRLYFEGLLRQFEDADPESALATIELDAMPRAHVTLSYIEERGRRLIPVRDEPLGETPIKRPIQPGAYLITLSSGARPPVKLPLMVAPGDHFSSHSELLPQGSILPGELLIPAGVALLGGDESSLLGRELVEVNVPAFAIAELPVSFDEYLAFIDELYREDPTAAERHMPRMADRQPGWQWSRLTLIPSACLRWGSDELVRKLPCFGIDAESAMAYARWRSRKEGRRYRLPTEWEWEKAARGTDGRRYPWGDRFDAAFCKMRESRAGEPAPEPRGLFEADCSPYGVRDMAGGVAEWVQPPQQHDLSTKQVASKGGAWCDWRVDCSLGARRTYGTDERSSRVGFRLARSFERGTEPPPGRTS